MLLILVHVNQLVFFFSPFVDDYIFCYFLAWGLVSGLGLDLVCLYGIGKGNLPSRGQPYPIVNLPAFRKLSNKK